MSKLVAPLALVALVACKGGSDREPEDPAPDRQFASSELMAELNRVFAPMDERLSAAANVLEIDVSRALYDRFTNPARSEVHQLSFDPGPPSVYRYKNVGGGFDLPLKFVIGKQTWLVTQGAIVRVHGGTTPRFELRASGDVLLQRPKLPPQRAREVVVRDATWSAK